ncbi:MAG TPA: glycosyltransferase family 4 protein [Steroidobacteraceae bacterium]|nr:glycosyltransferase family 4 protein [Steroidobacteraceae bacterium]
MAKSYRLGFVMEQTLGHVTHAKNLQQCISHDPEIIPTWIPVTAEVGDRWDKVPFVRSNWTLRASLRARDKVRAALRTTELDGLFFHTSVTSIFSRGLMGRIPTVISMDATPLNFDSIGRPYDHSPSSLTLLESIKNSINRGTFNKAARLVTWCEWTKDSLMSEYGMGAAKIRVIPPGVDLDKWKTAHEVEARLPVRLLFVGGDFRRKGGETLLRAFRQSLSQECELDIITREPVDTTGLTGVRVHHGLGPNAPQLMQLYAQADIFVFPTEADVLPLAIMEAMASGLPVITTEVGGLREQVENGVTGFLVPLRDAGAVAAATLQLVRDPGLRRRMSTAARQVAEQKYNAAVNYQRLLDVCKESVDKA